MNCRDFENTVVDLTRGLLMDAALQKRGLEHAENCARCAARLADERSLTAGLRVLSADNDGKSASPDVETALLAAFRRQPSKTGLLEPVRVARRLHHPLWALAAAAVVLIALGLIVYRAFQATPAKQDLVDGNRQAISSPTPAPEQQKRDLQDNRSALSQDDTVKSKSRLTEKRPRNTSRKRGVDSQTTQFLIRDGMTLYASDTEVTTDFLPVTYSLNLPPMESGQLIRVQMPRSALLKFGLPMNVDRANVPVKADLLLGEDGLAQAIRFIR